MNLFTRFLKQWNRDKDLDLLVDHCDALEALIIRVYKQGEASAADEAEYHALRAWLLANYGQWEKALQSLWRETQVAGAPADKDPFRRLIESETAADFVGDWEAMQNLPAAREALNRLVLRQQNEETS
ncbi:MAG TPA: hypothetical protein VK879_07330 [Candidatus Sulfomarinibacteraceae bacterium]|nr:hypothetical protein [Candidatus Sulfomarinibacteraceae bacterium]